MGQIFEPYEPDQAHLFPPSPRDWLPDGHLCFFISETVEQLDLSEPAIARMGKRLKTKRGRARFKRRKAIVEPVFGYALPVKVFRLMMSGAWKMLAMPPPSSQ
jgi:hypothetical protein